MGEKEGVGREGGERQRRKNKGVRERGVKERRDKGERWLRIRESGGGGQYVCYSQSWLQTALPWLRQPGSRAALCTIFKSSATIAPFTAVCALYGSTIFFQKARSIHTRLSLDLPSRATTE